MYVRLLYLVFLSQIQSHCKKHIIPFFWLPGIHKYRW